MDKKMKSARNLGIEKLYKYRVFDRRNTKYIETIIKNNELYFPSPSSLNDPFECQFQIKVGDLNDLEYRSQHRAWAYNAQKPLKPKVSFEEYLKYYDTISIERHLINTNKIRDDNFEIIDQRWGILSLSKDPLNVLMWAHYANNHDGICFEFDTNNDYFGRAWQVNYVNKIKHLDILEMNEDEAFNAFLTKTNAWNYEDEFRVLSDVYGKVKGLPIQIKPNVAPFKASMLTGIIFGARMLEDDISMVSSWLGEQHKHVKLQRIVLDKDGSLSRINI